VSSVPPGARGKIFTGREFFEEEEVFGGVDEVGEEKTKK